MTKRALISVFDKTGIVPLAKALQECSWEIISTGGTLKVLEKEGIVVSDISRVTKNPEVFGGRVKTLSFQISSAILFDREKDLDEAKALEIEPIDFVVCNCYPFEQVYKRGAEISQLVENIDIGGPTMIRSAAKNFMNVSVLTDPKDYPSICEELKSSSGRLCLKTRKKLMRKAFNYVADYDACIAMAMDKEEEIHSLRLSFSEGRSLRYGENSHQKAFFFRERQAEHSLYDMKLLQGKQLSYNNLMDINSAVDGVKDLKRSGCAIIKHNTPCGLSESETSASALSLAWRADPISSFGSVIAFNRSLNEKDIDFFQFSNPDKGKRKFIEAIVAPGFSPKILESLSTQKSLRLVEYQSSFKENIEKEFRYFKGSLLLQDTDSKLFERLSCVTIEKIKIDEEFVEFGLKAVKQVKSNAIAVVRKLEDGSFQLLGMGAGQPNRLISVSLAIDKCRQNLIDEFDGVSEERECYVQRELGKSLLISEAFFPFRDSVDFCARHGIKAILQPGGSIRDKEVIQACDDHKVAMVLTGLRHFKH